MKIRALKALTIRDSETGNLTSIASGAIAEVSDTLGESLITDGLAEAYILIAPTGTIEITSNGTVDVAEYAEASVNIADFKNFIGGTLTQVTASMLNGITSIRNNAFIDYTPLTSVVIPAGVTSIGDYAFKGCTSLASVTIPEGVTSIGAQALKDCPIPNLTLPSTVQSVDTGAIYPSVECSLTMLSATPPYNWGFAINYNVTAVYVPAEYVDVYKADQPGYADMIHAIPT